MPRPIRNTSERVTGNMRRINFQNQKYPIEKQLMRINSLPMLFLMSEMHFINRINLKKPENNLLKMPIRMSDKIKKSAGLYNLGNSLLKANKLQESIDAYKSSLKLRPDNPEAKYNLAYAQDLLKKQQEQQKKQQQE